MWHWFDGAPGYQNFVGWLLVAAVAHLFFIHKDVKFQNRLALPLFVIQLCFFGLLSAMYVLELLSKQNCCYSGDLSEELPIVKSTLSQHLKELKDAGLIQGEIEAPRIRYCINRENWKEAQELFRHFLQL